METTVVTFTTPQEFVEELERDKEAVEERIVRATVRHARQRSGISFVSVVGTYVVRTKEGVRRLVRLDYQCGSYYAADSSSSLAENVNSKTNEAQKFIEGRALILGLQYRPGISRIGDNL